MFAAFGSAVSLIEAATSGPQTILGVEEIMREGERDPLLEGKRILVADDEASIRETIREVLEQKGCAVAAFASGAPAIDRARAEAATGNPFDLVISDVRMPDRNGYEVFAAVKEADPRTPVILMTGFGYDPNHSIVRASQEGLQSVLFKPFQVEQLVDHAGVIDEDFGEELTPRAKLDVELQARLIKAEELPEDAFAAEGRRDLLKVDKREVGVGCFADRA